MKKLTVDKSCSYCKQKIAHIIILANEKGESHVHAPFNDKLWMNFMVREFNKIIKQKKSKEK